MYAADDAISALQIFAVFTQKLGENSVSTLVKTYQETGLGRKQNQKLYEYDYTKNMIYPVYFQKKNQNLDLTKWATKMGKWDSKK